MRTGLLLVSGGELGRQSRLLVLSREQQRVMTSWHIVAMPLRKQRDSLAGILLTLLLFEKKSRVRRSRRLHALVKTLGCRSCVIRGIVVIHLLRGTSIEANQAQRRPTLV